MLLIAGLSLFAFFLFLGHSTLLYFYVEQSLNKPLPLIYAIFPWPNRGRFVGMLCLILAVGFFVMAFREPISYETMGLSELKVASIFMGLPGLFYGIFFARRITRMDGQFTFAATQGTRMEVSIPLIFLAVFLLITKFLV